MSSKQEAVEKLAEILKRLHLGTSSFVNPVNELAQAHYEDAARKVLAALSDLGYYQSKQWANEVPTEEGLYWFSGNTKTNDDGRVFRKHYDLLLVEISRVPPFDSLNVGAIQIRDSKYLDIYPFEDCNPEHYKGKWLEFRPPASTSGNG